MSNAFEVTTKYCVKKRNKVFTDYVASRNWTDETLDNWELGIFPDDGLLGLKVKAKQSGLTIDDLKSVHIMRENYKTGDTSIFFNRIIFPIWDAHGKYISITGRVLDEKTKPKYYNTYYEKGKHLYGLNFAIDEIRKKDLVYVFEGNADVVTTYQHGIKNCVCVMGTAMTEDHLKLLSRYTKNIVLVFDNDTGGRDALGSFNEKKLDTKRRSTNIFRCSFKEYRGQVHKDADEFINAFGGEEFVKYMESIINDKTAQNKLKYVKKQKRTVK